MQTVWRHFTVRNFSCCVWQFCVCVTFRAVKGLMRELISGVLRSFIWAYYRTRRSWDGETRSLQLSHRVQLARNMIVPVFASRVYAIALLSRFVRDISLSAVISALTGVCRVEVKRSPSSTTNTQSRSVTALYKLNTLQLRGAQFPGESWNFSISFLLKLRKMAINDA